MGVLAAYVVECTGFRFDCIVTVLQHHDGSQAFSQRLVPGFLQLGLWIDGGLSRYRFVLN